MRYAMIEQLRSPVPELRDAIFAHFRLRRAAILANVRRMASDPKNSKAHANNMAALVRQLEEALNANLPAEA